MKTQISIIQEYKTSHSFMNEKHVIHAKINECPFTLEYLEDFLMVDNSIVKGHVEVSQEDIIDASVSIEEIEEIILQRTESLDSAYEVLAN